MGGLTVYIYILLTIKLKMKLSSPLDISRINILYFI